MQRCQQKSVFSHVRTAGILATGLITAVILLAFLLPLPKIPGLGWSDRNLFFHVPMWFSMYGMMGVSVFWSGAYLLHAQKSQDVKAKEAAVVAAFFGALGLGSGIIWSRATWAEALPDTDPQAWWGWDPKQTFALIALLMYGAYFVLRQSVRREEQRARLAAVYNIIATIMVIPLTFFLPRYLGGLHPGTEGTPAFRTEDISIPHRIVFYLAVIGFLSLGVWIWQIRCRLVEIEAKLRERSAITDDTF